MQPLQVPCPAHLVPDATGTNAFHDAYRNAVTHNAVFVAIESEGQQWTVKADTLAAGSGHMVAGAVSDAIRAAILRLVDHHEVDLGASAGPVHFMVHSVRNEERTRRRTPRCPLQSPCTPGPRRPSRILTLS
ncbi:hypothetical protein ACH4F6_33820 [Streptomyces sp. NPDC017936]|uniref:hypothetical protein n=1 Tax=Streptomyces sp. NPDC017936 TaxID=3365016 RepID=UPI0037A266A5